MKKYILVFTLIIGLAKVLFSQTQVGDVLREKKIDNYYGNLGNILNSNDKFGRGIANIGDINGDGISDLAVGAPGNGYGRVYILLMDTNGTIKSKKELTQNQNGVSGLTYGGEFGRSVASIGDINNDGIVDIVVGEFLCNDGYSNTGAIHIICLDSTGVALSQKKSVKLLAML